MNAGGDGRAALEEPRSLWSTVDPTFLVHLGTAFVGGLILNVMPCVLPVLAMKVFHVMEHADDDAASHRAHGIAYAAGVLGTFLALAIGLLAVKAGGSLVGWGMQFSNPAFVASMVCIIFVFALNALGVFEIAIAMQSKEERGGYAGSVMNGVIASIMSTPCSAPMVGSAAAVALSASAAWQTLAIFLVMGLGLAAPFLVFSFAPGLSKFLPRPGAWMETFKHLMGFTLLAAAVWLFGVFMRQTSTDSAQGLLVFLFALGVSAWAYGRFGGLSAGTTRRWVVRGALSVALIASGSTFLKFEPREVAAQAVVETELSVVDDEIQWRQFDSALVMETLATGRPVFMDYTADWCVNCKANERLFIDTERVRQALTDTQILPMQADLTVENEEIRRWLEPFPYSGIPVYVIYLPDQTYDLLPQVLTVDLLEERLLAAGARFPWQPSL